MTELLDFQVSSSESWFESLYLSNDLHQRLFLHPSTAGYVYKLILSNGILIKSMLVSQLFLI